MIMRSKFAKIRPAAHIDELDFDHSFIKKAPFFIKKRYAKKFTPLGIIDTELCGLSGYEIVFYGESAAYLEKLEDTAKYLGVCAVYFDTDMPPIHGFFVPTGFYAKLFFLEQIIDKIVKVKKIEPAGLKLILIEGDEQITKALLRSLYERLNYLGLILENGHELLYSGLAYEIFENSGLNLSFGQRGSYLLKEADIIINLSEDNKGYESFYKKGSSYIELSENPAKLHDIYNKRLDILTVDKFSVDYEGSILPLKLFELILYLQSSSFYNFSGKKNVEENFIETENWIKYRNIRAKKLNF